MKFRVVIFLLTLFFIASCTPVPTSVPTKNSITQTPKASNTPGANNVLLDYAFSQDGETLAVYLNTGIDLYDLPSMRKSTFMKFSNDDYFPRLPAGAIAFSQNREDIAISGKFSNSPITIYNIKSKKAVAKITKLPSGYNVTELAFSPSGKTILVRNTDPSSIGCEGPEDKVALYALNTEAQLFSIDKCKIYPPIRFRFTNDQKIFLYFGSMTPAYSIYFIDANIGNVISKTDYDWNENGNFFDVSADGEIQLIDKVENIRRVTQLLDAKSHNLLNTFEGKITFFQNENSFIVMDYSDQHQWSYWENKKLKCVYTGISNSPDIKTTASGKFFAVPNSNNEHKIDGLKIWKVSTCELLSKLVFNQ